MTIQKPKITDSIIGALEAGVSSTKVEDSSAVATSYNNLRSWIGHRYPDISLKALDNGGLKAQSRSALAKQLETLKATDDIELLHRTMRVHEQMTMAPETLLNAVGVNLENVKAEKITIKDIYVNLPKPAEAPGFHCVMAYLEQVSQLTTVDTIRFDNDRRSTPKRKLSKIPVRLKTFSNELADDMQVYDAVQNSFRQDRQIERIERVMLLGDVGGGKTDALVQLRKQVALDSLHVREFYNAEGEISTELVVPIYIDLGDLYNERTLATLIRDEFNRHISAATDFEVSAEQIPRLLKSYKCLILLDSLDIHISDRARLEEIRSFMENNSHEQYVIACRRSSYRGQLGSLDELVVADLSLHFAHVK